MWPERLQEFAFAHNTTYHESIQCTPFEVAHGTRARTLTDALASGSGPIVVSDEDTFGYYGDLRQRAQAYHDIAKLSQSQAALEQNRRLNGNSIKRTFQVGEHVSIYFPKRALDTSWKQKHLVQWRGPMRVIEKSSDTTYVMEDVATGQRFERSITNINPYNAPVTERKQEQKGSEGKSLKKLKKRAEESKDTNMPFDVVPGTLYAVKDDIDSSEFWLAECTKADAEEATFHYWGTTSARAENAVFKPAHIGGRTGKTILAHNPRQRDGEPTAAWTGTLGHELVIGPVQLRQDKQGLHRLTASSRRRLTDLKMARL